MRRVPLITALVLAGIAAFLFFLSGDLCGRSGANAKTVAFVVSALLFGWAASVVAAATTARSWAPSAAAILTTLVALFVEWVIFLVLWFPECEN
jgi:hypothetical protein